MIEKNEVLKMATELGLRSDTIEKDYILGWMLWANSLHMEKFIEKYPVEITAIGPISMP